MKKFILTIAVVVCLILGIGVMSANAATYTGSCGDNVTYSLNTNNGVLTINGEGNMWDYSYKVAVPWDNYTDYIKSVVINKGVTRIGDSAFEDCCNLTSVTIPDGVRSIGDYAFDSCDSLIQIEMPGSVTKLGSGIFSYCENLGKVVICDGVPAVGKSMFFECSNLVDVSIPNSVKVIENCAFEMCTNLKSITIPESVIWIGELAFLECKSLENINIDCNIKSLEVSTFYKCDNLKDVTIPEGVISIEEKAFRECDKLTSVTIPKSVTKIGNAAFYHCDELTDVYYCGSESEWAEIDFGIWGNDELLNAVIHYAEEGENDAIIPDDAGMSPEIGNTTLMFTPKNATEGDIIAVLVVKDGVSTSYAKTYSGSGTVTFEIEKGFNSMKILVWDSYESMEPLMEEYATIE